MLPLLTKKHSKLKCLHHDISIVNNFCPFLKKILHCHARIINKKHSYASCLDDFFLFASEGTYVLSMRTSKVCTTATTHPKGNFWFLPLGPDECYKSLRGSGRTNI